MYKYPYQGAVLKNNCFDNAETLLLLIISKRKHFCRKISNIYNSDLLFLSGRLSFPWFVDIQWAIRRKLSIIGFKILVVSDAVFTGISVYFVTEKVSSENNFTITDLRLLLFSNLVSRISSVIVYIFNQFRDPRCFSCCFLR